MGGVVWWHCFLYLYVSNKWCFYIFSNKNDEKEIRGKNSATARIHHTPPSHQHYWEFRTLCTVIVNIAILQEKRHLFCFVIIQQQRGICVTQTQGFSIESIIDIMFMYAVFFSHPPPGNAKRNKCKRNLIYIFAWTWTWAHLLWESQSCH